MVRTITAKVKSVFSPTTYYEYAGLSTDEKPVADDIITGSLFMEVDTGDVYAFDESTPYWYKIAELGGA